MSINNPDIINDIIKRLEEDAKSGELQKYFDELIEKEKANKQYVNRKEYFESLANFVQKFKEIDEVYSVERWLYMDKEGFTEEDIDCEKYIGNPIFDLFDDIGEQQAKKVQTDSEFDFPERYWYFKFNDKIYFLTEIIGQGTEYILREAFEDEQETKEYLDLDLYFKNT